MSINRTRLASPMRWLAATLGLTAGVVAIVAGGVGWAAGTPSGTRTVLNWVPGLKVEGSQGALLGDFSATRVEISWGTPDRVVLEDVHWQNLRPEVQPDLPWGFGLAMDTLNARQLRVELRGPSSGKPLPEIHGLSLPVRVRADHVSLAELRAPGLQDIPLTAISGRAALGADGGRWHEAHDAQAQWGDVRLQGHARIGAQAPLKVEGHIEAQRDAPPDTATRAGAPHLSWQAALNANGPLANMPLTAELDAADQSLRASARITPFIGHALSALDVRAESLDLQAIHPKAPRTALTGEVALALTRPPGIGVPPQIQLKATVRNTLARPLDDGGLPLSDLNLRATSDPHHPTQGTLESLEAGMAGPGGSTGQLRGHGQWTFHPPTETSPLTLDAELHSELTEVQTQAIHRSASALVLSGPLHLHTQGLPLQARPTPNPTNDTTLGDTTPGSINARAGIQGQWSDAARPGAGLRQPFNFKLDATAKVLSSADLSAATSTVTTDTTPSFGPWRLQSVDIRDAQIRAAAGTASLHSTLHPEPRTKTDTAAASAPPRWRWQAEAKLQQFDLRVLGLDQHDNIRRNHELNAEADWNLSLPEHTPPANDLAQWTRYLASLRGKAAVNIMDSRLYGVPIKAALDMQTARDDGRWHVQTHIDAAGNQATASAMLSPQGNGSTDQWRLQLQAPNLAPLSPLLPTDLVDGPALRGDLQGDLALDGRWPRVHTQGQFQVRDLRWQALNWPKGQIQWIAGSQPESAWDIRLDGQDLQWGPERLHTVEAQMQGSTQNHTLALRADRAARTPLQPVATPPTWMQAWIAHARLDGGLQGLDTLNTPSHRTEALQWRGQIRSLSVRPADAQGPASAAWLDLKPTDLSLTHHPTTGLQATAGPAMMQMLDAELRLNTLQWSQPPDASASFDLDLQLPPLSVAALLTRAQPSFGWNGDLTVVGQLQMHRHPGNNRTELTLQRQHGDLTITDDTGSQSLGLEQLAFTIHGQDGQWRATQAISGRSLGSIEGQQRVSADPQAVIPGPQAELQGQVKLQIANLGTLGTWLPITSVGAGWRLSGSLQSEARLSGQLGAPLYTGELHGQALGVRNSLEGIQLSDGRIDVVMDGTQARIDTLEFKGGEGHLRLTGGATFGATPRAQLHAQAERFALLQRVDRRIVLSGAAQLALSPALIDASGTLHIDQGLFDLSRADAPSLGDDVDLVNSAETPDAHTAEASPTSSKNGSPKRETRLNLTINAGDQLKLRGRGLDTRLKGELRLSTNASRRLLANGTILTEDGTFAAFGQLLNLERGNLEFTGVLENPRLDIQAMRPPPPGSDDSAVKVGVAITGTAQEPQIRLFSEPEMSETDKLSWLVLGQSSEGLSRNSTAVLARAASALLAKEGEDPNQGFVKNFGLDELSVSQGDGETRETIVKIGKQLSRRWYWAYERSLNATSGTWQILYHAANRVTVRAQWQQGEERALDVIRTWRWE